MTDVDLERCYREFYARMNPGVPATDTAAGVPKRPATHIMRHVGRRRGRPAVPAVHGRGGGQVPPARARALAVQRGGASAKDMASYLRYKKAISHVEVCDDAGVKALMHLDAHYVYNATDCDGAPVLREDGHSPVRCVDVCSKCHAALCRGQRPPISIASGYDLGHPEDALLPRLSTIERLCVQTHRALVSTLRPRRMLSAGARNLRHRRGLFGLSFTLLQHFSST